MKKLSHRKKNAPVAEVAPKKRIREPVKELMSLLTAKKAFVFFGGNAQRGGQRPPLLFSLDLSEIIAIINLF